MFLPREVRRLKLDLFHSPTGIAPARLPCSSIITLHDLAFRRYPELFSGLHCRYLNFAIPRSARHATRVFTDSGFSRDEILSQLSLPEEKVFPVHLGVSEDFQPVRDPQRLEVLRRQYNLPDRFILALGTVEPRKNLMALIEAFATTIQNDPDLSLVLVGRRGWKEEPVFEKIEELKISDKVVWTGFLPRQDLPGVYSLATLCAYLSVYEGFGLPVLEAMACGTPVIASDLRVCRELISHKQDGWLVEPQSIRSWAIAIRHLLSQPELLNQLSSQARLKAKRYFSRSVVHQKLMQTFTSSSWFDDVQINEDLSSSSSWRRDTLIH